MRYKISISKTEQQLGNVRIPQNAIIIQDEYGELTMCKDFPRYYKGTNPTLKIWYYDDIHECWEQDLWQNETTRVLWKIYVNNGRKKLPQLIYPQVCSVYNKVPHDTKIGNVQMSCYCDPEKRKRNEYAIGGYDDTHKPRQSSIYHYHSSIGTYGKAGDSMSI